VVMGETKRVQETTSLGVSSFVAVDVGRQFRHHSARSLKKKGVGGGVGGRKRCRWW
jgi:hypothetical protein